MSRTIVIGDTHGCYVEALDLLHKLDVQKTDRVIFLGDLIDRGPFPKEMVELAMKHESILGNHEENLVDHRARGKGWGTLRSEEHVRSFRALDDVHWNWLEKLPLWLELPEHNVLLVHAGLIPDVPVKQQHPQILLHGQMLRRPAQGLTLDGGIKHGYWTPTRETKWPSKVPAHEKADWTFWFNEYRGPQKVVFGHTVFSAPLITEWCFGIDTGCVFGRNLTALVLPEWKIVQVKARREYFPCRSLTYQVGDVFCLG
jgi:hypothetical protein